jgi:hypothetical protein
VESASSSMASGSQDRSQSRNSSPVRRRLAEVMVLEAKAAAAAVLRSPNDSGTRSMCSSPADTGRMVEQQRVLERPYSPTRSVKGSGKPTQQASHNLTYRTPTCYQLHHVLVPQLVLLLTFVEYHPTHYQQLALQGLVMQSFSTHLQPVWTLRQC